MVVVRFLVFGLIRRVVVVALERGVVVVVGEIVVTVTRLVDPAANAVGLATTTRTDPEASPACAVMVAVPVPTPSTTPPETVATLLALVVHATPASTAALALVPSLIVPVTVMTSTCPTLSFTRGGDTRSLSSVTCRGTDRTVALNADSAAIWSATSCLSRSFRAVEEVLSLAT